MTTFIFIIVVTFHFVSKTIVEFSKIMLFLHSTAFEVAVRFRQPIQYTAVYFYASMNQDMFCSFFLLSTAKMKPRDS